MIGQRTLSAQQRSDGSQSITAVLSHRPWALTTKGPRKPGGDESCWQAVSWSGGSRVPWVAVCSQNENKSCRLPVWSKTPFKWLCSCLIKGLVLSFAVAFIKKYKLLSCYSSVLLREPGKLSVCCVGSVQIPPRECLLPVTHSLTLQNKIKAVMQTVRNLLWYFSSSYIINSGVTKYVIYWYAVCFIWNKNDLFGKILLTWKKN